ncbi:hypothetical protein KJ708_14185 [bacterium]|nr:hypothetical protein [bacterium]MBU1918068.1 hypothetical protein [bacterium]
MMSSPLFTTGFTPQIHVVDLGSSGSLAQQQVQSCVAGMSIWMTNKFQIEDNTKPHLQIDIRDEKRWDRPRVAYPLAHWQVGQIILPESGYHYFQRFFRPFLSQDLTPVQINKLSKDLEEPQEPETYDGFLRNFPEQGAFDHFIVKELLTHEMGHHILYATDIARHLSMSVNEMLASWIKASYKRIHYNNHDRLDWLFDIMMDSVGTLVSDKKSAIINPYSSLGFLGLFNYIWFGLKHEHDVARPFGYTDPQAIVKVIERLQQEIQDLKIPPLTKELRIQNAPNFPGKDIPISNKRFVELVAEALNLDLSDLVGNPDRNLTFHTLYHTA